MEWPDPYRLLDFLQERFYRNWQGFLKKFIKLPSDTADLGV